MNKMTRVQRKRKRRRFFLRTILLIVLLILALIFVFRSEFFSINGIRVIGNKKLSQEIIINTSNIEKNDNIFKINIKNIEEKIEKLSYIKEASINRKLPKSIEINVIERKEDLKIKQDQSYILLDKEGYILEEIEIKVLNLPELIGFDIRGKSLGDNLFLEIEQFSKDFIEEAKKLTILEKMVEIELLENNNIDILLSNGTKVAFGNINDVKYKLNLLKEVLKDLEDRNIKYKMILMDRGDNPVIVLEDEEEEG